MSIDIAEGYYTAKPTCSGLTSSKNGHDQFAIEVAIEVPDTSAEDGKRVVHMTKFGGLENDESLGYTARDAETCGCDVTKDIREWTVDTGRAVRVHVVDNGEYGMKLKSIFPADPPGGVLVKKQAMADDRKAVVAQSVNERLAALRAKSGKSGPAPTPARKPPPQVIGNEDDIPF
jgi:hypothetical protein